MQEYVGFLGAALLAVCALPQAIQSIRQGNSDGLSEVFLICWYSGELFMFSYVLVYVPGFGPLFWNYFLNTILLTIIVYYRYFPRR